MSRILVTVFGPFLLAPSTYLFGNASKELGDELERRSRLGTLDVPFDYRVLPVNQCSGMELEKLAKALNPSGIVAMGQADTFALGRIEGWAYSPRATGAEKKEQLESPFAREVAQHVGTPLSDKIGNIQCNEVYYQALKWAAGKRPVVFLHIGRFGNLQTKADWVGRILRFMATFRR